MTNKVSVDYSFFTHTMFRLYFTVSTPKFPFLYLIYEFGIDFGKSPNCITGQK